MQLVSILLITVSILTILSGLAVFFGAKKGDRSRSAWFLVATFFALLWTVSIVIFLRASSEIGDMIYFVVDLTYLSAIFIDIALLGYISWKQKYGKVLTLVFLIIGVFLSGVFLSNPGLLYSEVVFGTTGNSLVINMSPFFYIYNAFFCCLVPAVMITLLRKIIKTPKNKRGGDIVLLIGFAISGMAALIFNLILPLWRWDLIWVGPLAISVTIVSFYYAILRYRSLHLNSMWLKALSYIVIVASAAVIYMVIFFVIFAALFKGSTPSMEVILLNFIMILIVLSLLPVTNELMDFVRSLISTDQFDVVYVIKRLSKVSVHNTDLKELAAFLAEHMHFEYVGFIINGQVYGSERRDFDDSSVRFVAKLGEPEHGVWQEFNEESQFWMGMDLSAVAALRNANGHTFGQMMIGKPMHKTSLSRKDLAEVETVVNLVSVIVDSKTKKKG